MKKRSFRIHGDNIVECERLFTHIRMAHGTNYRCYGPFGAPATPMYYLKANNDILNFHFFPGFGRWDKNILDIITSVPGTLREAADAILTEIIKGYEMPLMAVEYCSALAAGNNAWQRSGRAYSFAKAGIPFFYYSEIGGIELNAFREDIASRFPNPTVPFSYISQSTRSGFPVMPVYECNPAASDEIKKHFHKIMNQGIFEKILFSIIHGCKADKLIIEMDEKVVLFLELLQSRQGEKNKREDIFKARKAFEFIKKGGSFSQYLDGDNLFDWAKTITIPITKTAGAFLKNGCNYGKGITKASLPISYIRSTERKTWASEVRKIYRKKLSDEYYNWLSLEEPLVICWVAGFKPKGEDSRPDRGLVPLARMLFGEDVHILSFIYGPLKKSQWVQVKAEPAALMGQNGLWESVLTLSTAILVDSMTISTTPQGYTQNHWNDYKYVDSYVPKPFYCVGEEPASYKEHDVDTVLHNIIAHCKADVSFEGMCNPPGGDWSGISIIDIEKGKEYRWLTLNRVSGSGKKRPDHVFQLFLNDKKSMVIFSIESKELGSKVEPQIGPMLRKYISAIFQAKPNSVRNYPGGSWEKYEGAPLSFKAPVFTGIVFITGNQEQLTSVLKKSKADIAWGFEFSLNGKKCNIISTSNSKVGKSIVLEIEKMINKTKSHYSIKTL